MAIKRLLLLLSFSFSIITASAQQKMNYTLHWKKIDSLLEKNGLVQTALTEVNKVYEQAKKEANEIQLIKALVYRFSLSAQITENGETDNLFAIEKEIASSQQPAKSILYSIAAGNYWNYFQQNRWKFYNRTSTLHFKKEDPDTWNAEDFHQKISSLYLASLKEKELLKKSKLELYDPLIIKGNTRHLRPTLFDLIAHRALDYFKNDERYINKPAYAFELNDPAAFANANEFAAHHFTTRDSLSLHYQALLLFQQIIHFHLTDSKPDALIDINTERLQFVHNHSTLSNKDELYKTALEKILDQYGQLPAASQAYMMLAEWHMAKARSYDPLKDTTGRYAYLQAKDICQKAITVNGDSEGRNNFINLLTDIRSRQISMQSEKVNLPNEPFRMLVSYRNFTTGYFRLVKIDQSLKSKLGRDTWDEKFWLKLLDLPVLQQFSNQFPDTKDHQQHRAEIKMNALPIGEYVIIASPDKQFDAKNSTLAFSYLYVSDIAYVNSNNQYYVLSRNNGQPLAAATVQLWQEYYDSKSKKQELKKLNTYVTDKTGFFEIPLKENNNSGMNYKMAISHQNDRLFLDDHLYSYVYNDPNDDGNTASAQTFLFSDRSLYRPGQIVYFKGIVVTRSTKENPSAVITNRKSVVSLLNANGDTVDSVTLTTNTFGSYSGKFTLPAGVLNGNFSIRDNSSIQDISIKVEEYKRPKFFVEIPKPAGTFRIQDTIQAVTIAQSFAGNPIDGASVTYRIVRRMPMIRRSYAFSKIWPPYNQEAVEIAHGEGTTDSAGKFNISFKAIPDNSIPQEQNPLFYYEVTADVTDINGETRTGTTIISVGYKALKMEMDVPASAKTDSFKTILVSTSNMNDVFESSTVNITIYRLNAPAKIFRERYWEQPDQFVMTKEVYYQLFPFDIYSNENDPEKWSREKKVFETSRLTKPDSVFKIKGAPLPEGWYAVEASATDKFGEQVKETRYIRLFRHQTVSPFAKDANEKNLTTTATGYQIAIDHNRVFIQPPATPIADPGKNLEISYVSFRDKTLPGHQEKWKVKISGYKRDKAVAEILTAMYDASLDQFYSHNWQPPTLSYYPIYTPAWQGLNNFTQIASTQKYAAEHSEPVVSKIYDMLNIPYEGYSNRRSYATRMFKNDMIAGAPEAAINQSGNSSKEAGENEQSTIDDSAVKPSPQPAVQPRTNLNETAFFYPNLLTDSAGNVEFSFTAPEALTEWKWMLLAHTKDLAFGYSEKRIVTQKQLMVQPNAPRFLRQGDKMEFSTKIVNMTSQAVTGRATLQLLDATNGEVVDHLLSNHAPEKTFSIAAGQSTSAHFSIQIPDEYINPVTWRIIASAQLPDSANKKGATISDGEESVLPVISNRMLVTETLPLPVKGNTTQSFSFEKLLQSGASKTLQQYGLTVEYTSNPSWYVVQALPYLAEGEKENAEQLFNRYYANALAAKIATTSPKLRSIIEKWNSTDTAALLSNLQKNEELKSLLLQETPWVLEAKTEAQQKKNIAVLFDMVRLSSNLHSALDRLKTMQSPGGGFTWLKGGPDDRYMTQYILSGFGKLKKLGAIPDDAAQKINALIIPALAFLDQQLKKDYDILKKKNKKLPAGVADEQVQYLYMRSFFTDISVPGDVFAAYNYYRNQSKQSWLKQNTCLRGMTALSLFRTGDIQNATKIMNAIRETAIINKELGMYWKDMAGGYYWHQAPVESQALMIEAFSETSKTADAVGQIKTWLLKNKQTNNWKTSRSTADACYALLLQGTDWLTQQPVATIQLGALTVSSGSQQPEEGTRYFKTTIAGNAVQPEMGNISVTVSGNNTASPSWGGVYWQYFENLDKITNAATPLQLKKQLFIQQYTDRGPVLEPLSSNNQLHVGDKITVRIELRADRDMEYIHMKDMRGACMEPVQVLSEYRWQGGLGYYQSTKDASTDFFFDRLNKGVYVFEYNMNVTHNGTFSNGITQIQCMYAPEFSSHSEGLQLNIQPK